MNRDILKAQLIEHEAIRLYPYKDTVGKVTIGVGRNLDDRGITEKEAMFLLDNDMNSVFLDLDKSFPWWRGLDDIRQLVLADMCFNLGISRLLKFRNTLAFIKAGDYSKASVNMLKSLWAKQVGKRAIQLAKMMREGQS